MYSSATFPTMCMLNSSTALPVMRHSALLLLPRVLSLKDDLTPHDGAHVALAEALNARSSPRTPISLVRRASAARCNSFAESYSERLIPVSTASRLISAKEPALAASRSASSGYGSVIASAAER